MAMAEASHTRIFVKFNKSNLLMQLKIKSFTLEICRVKCIGFRLYYLMEFDL